MEYNVGNTIKDTKRNITLTRSRRRNGRLEYQYKCNICGYDCGESFRDGKFEKEYWLDFSHLKYSQTGCSCCSGRAVVSGINNVGYTHPSIAKYFVNDIDKLKYTYGSTKKIEVACPFCHSVKKIQICNLTASGFKCPICSDNMSLGEKIFYLLLQSLHIPFVKEFSSKEDSWTGRYRYDFFIKPNTIVEIMGRQHKDGSFEQLSGRTLKQEQENDSKKKELALKNGIKNYIEIDADITDSLYIKENITNSELKEFINFNNVNWDDILLKSEKPILIDVCSEWENNNSITTGGLVKKFNLSYGVIQNYLKRGTELGLCSYDPINYRKENFFENNSVNTATPIKCIETNSYFKSYGLCSRISERVFGVKLNDCSIRSVLLGKYKQHRGYHFSYVTQQEFNNAYNDGLPCYGSPFVLS